MVAAAGGPLSWETRLAVITTLRAKARLSLVDRAGRLE
jgi:hypothetical protein